MLLNTLQSNFSLGELAPELQGWLDLPAFKRGMYAASNFVIGPNGGLSFRPGTYYAGQTAGNQAPKLIPFVYSDGSAYVLEATPGRLRFYTNNGSLDVSYTVTNATWAGGTAQVTVSAAHVFQVGDTVTIASIVATGGTLSYNGTFIITAVGTFTISYALGATGGTYSSGGTAVGQYQIVTPFITPQTLPQSWAQSDDVLYLTDPTGTVPPQQLTRLGAANWTITAIPFTAGPFLNANISATTMTVTASVDVAASVATFAATDVGRLIMVLDPSDSYNGSAGMYKYGVIATFTDTQHVIVSSWSYTTGTIDTPVTFISTAAQTDWRLGKWCATIGYPVCVTLHQQRLIFGGNANYRYKQNFVGSVAGFYTGMSPFDPDGTVNPDNSYDFNVSSGRADAISWIMSGRQLFIGTTEAEYAATSQGPAVTPTDISVVLQTTLGSTINPISLSYRLMLIQKGGLMLLEWAYAYFLGGFIGNWANQMSSHITYPGVTRLGAVLSPFLRLIMPRSDGQVIIATDNNEQKGGLAATPGGTLGYTRITMGGSYTGGPAQVVDTCIIPTANFDQIWFCVKRTINGSTSYMLEYLTSDFNWNLANTMANAHQVDAGIVYAGVSTSTLTGLDYLDGQAVVGWDRANNIPIAATVAGGSITLTTATTAAVVGLSYAGSCKSMQLADPRIQGHQQYAAKVYLRLYNTYNGSLLTGPQYNQTIPITESLNKLYSGSTMNVPDQGYETSPSVAWQQVSPYPMTVLSISTDYLAGSSG